MKLLLHTCCAPCLIWPLESLSQKGFEVTGFFYNPNIHPLAEYKNRKEAIEKLRDGSETEAKLSPKEGHLKIDFRTVPILYPEYKPEDFFQAVNLKESNPGRCEICWFLRLSRTAKEAREKGFSHFSTTLLVSPYQDQELLKKIGEDTAKESDVEFLYDDFRPGFKKAHEEAKAKGIYCQRYCGCIYSEIEQCRKSKKY